MNERTKCYAIIASAISTRVCRIRAGRPLRHQGRPSRRCPQVQGGQTEDEQRGGPGLPRRLKRQRRGRKLLQ